MTSPVAVSPEFDFIQRHLIPAESTYVRYCMYQAAEMSAQGNLVTSRLFSIPFVVASVALSFFNAISYLLQIPVVALLNIVRLTPLRLATDPVVSVINVARSLLFVSLGPALALSGLIFPNDVFCRFAPDSILAGEKRLEYENQELKGKVKELNEEVTTLTAALRNKLTESQKH